MPPSLSAALAISTLGLSGALWAASPNLSTEIVAEGLEHPWAMAFLPDGRYLVTERPGRMRIVQGDGRLGAPLAGLPAVEAAGQGGLLDVVLDSDFARNRQLYFCYSEPGSGADSGKNSTALASARLSDDASRLEQVKVLFSQRPRYASALHFGCRIVERRVDGKSDGTLFLALGERSRYKEEAQNLQSHLGKIVRIAKDGSVPRDNPFVGRADAWPEIWSYGHRNAQGAALAPDAANQSGANTELVESGLVHKVVDRMTVISESHEDLLRVMFAWMKDERAKLPDIETLWMPPKLPAFAERYDAAAKAIAAGVPRDWVMLNIVGMSPQELAREARPPTQLEIAAADKAARERQAQFEYASAQLAPSREELAAMINGGA